MLEGNTCLVAKRQLEAHFKYAFAQLPNNFYMLRIYSAPRHQHLQQARSPFTSKTFLLLADSCALSCDETSFLIKQHDNKQLLSINLFVLERSNTCIRFRFEGELVKSASFLCLVMWSINRSTYIKPLNKLANLFNHLSHKDDVHLVWEVGSVVGAGEQALSPGHHAGLIQRHLLERYRKRESVCVSSEFGQSRRDLMCELISKHRWRSQWLGLKGRNQIQTWLMTYRNRVTSFWNWQRE